MVAKEQVSAKKVVETLRHVVSDEEPKRPIICMSTGMLHHECKIELEKSK